MLRVTTGLPVAVSVAAHALSMKHVEHLSVAVAPSLRLSSEEQARLLAALHRASAACTSPPGFLIVVELVVPGQDSSVSHPQTSSVKNLLVASGVAASAIYEGEITTENARRRLATGALAPEVVVGSAEVEIVCNSKG